MTSITYYDLASEYYMAYPLDGLIEEAANRGFRFSVTKEPPPILVQAELGHQDRDLIHTLGIFQVRGGNTTKWFCIDSHDDSSAARSRFALLNPGCSCPGLGLARLTGGTGSR